MKSLYCSRRIMLLIGLMAALGAAAADEPAQAPMPNHGERAGRNSQPMSSPMSPNEPMPTGMAKKGMKKGDVMKAEKRKKTYMEEMMEQEKAAAGPRGR
jgi:hypothetical protein